MYEGSFRRIKSRIFGLGVLTVAAMTASAANAQFEACADTLGLLSPDGLRIEFERGEGRRSGNAVTWDLVPQDDAACYRLAVSPATVAGPNPQIIGDYDDIYDRFIEFVLAPRANGSGNSGAVGDVTQDRLTILIQGTHPNPVVPSVNGGLNVSNRGGLFRVDFANGRTQQVNGPTNEVPSIENRIPPHLSTTNITALAGWSDGASSVIYAAVEGLPLVRSEDGGATWRETALDGVDIINRPILTMAVSPTNPDILLLGTNNRGLWRSTDGGATFARADQSFVGGSSPRIHWVSFVQVSAPGGGTRDRVFVSASGIGFYVSDDDGATFTKSSLQVPDPNLPTFCYDAPPDPAVTPVVRALASSPTNPDTIYIGLQSWGVYKSTDGGDSWVAANDNGLVECAIPPNPGRKVNVLSLLVEKTPGGGGDVVWAGTDFDGSYLSGDGGDLWGTKPTPTDSTTGAPERILAMVEHPLEDAVIATTAQNGLMRLAAAGDWEYWTPAEPLLTKRLASLMLNPDPTRPSSILVGTTGAGVYLPGSDVPLDRLVKATLPTGSGNVIEIESNLGLTLGLSAADIDSSDSFQLIAQTFQGYAVWRAEGNNLETPGWKLIGLYDQTNPEFCFIGGCESTSPQFIPGCFADKRSNCFTFAGNEGRFFDADVFNGFTYQYAVSTFDYGYSGNTSPEAVSTELLFSPRTANESAVESALFLGVKPENYNRVTFQVNVDIAADLDNVFVVPNPLRGRAGWDDRGESSVRFVNVTPGAKCEVFNLAGDLVATIFNRVTSNEERGNIEWDTRNQTGRQVSSGVYIYRITDPQGNELISRFTIIR